MEKRHKAWFSYYFLNLLGFDSMRILRTAYSTCTRCSDSVTLHLLSPFLATSAKREPIRIMRRKKSDCDFVLLSKHVIRYRYHYNAIADFGSAKTVKRHMR